MSWGLIFLCLNLGNTLTPYTPPQIKTCCSSAGTKISCNVGRLFVASIKSKVQAATYKYCTARVNCFKPLVPGFFCTLPVGRRCHRSFVHGRQSQTSKCLSVFLTVQNQMLLQTQADMSNHPQHRLTTRAQKIPNGSMSNGTTHICRPTHMRALTSCTHYSSCYTDII